jgi:hypothetical protein
MQGREESTMAASSSLAFNEDSHVLSAPPSVPNLRPAGAPLRKSQLLCMIAVRCNHSVAVQHHPDEYKSCT